MKITGSKLVAQLVSLGKRRFYTIEGMPIHMITEDNYGFYPPQYIHELYGNPITVLVSFSKRETNAVMIWDDGKYTHRITQSINTMNVSPINSLLKHMQLQLERIIKEQSNQGKQNDSNGK